MHPQAFAHFFKRISESQILVMSGLGGFLLTSTPSELGKHPDGKDPKVCYQSPILVKFSKGQ